MKKILLLGATLVLASACSQKTKHTLGLTENLPDEYQVTRNKPLEVPPFYDGSAGTTNKKDSQKKVKKASKAE